MRKVFAAVVLLPVAAFLILLALANREPAVLSLDPFAPGAPEWSIQLPLFLIILIAVMVGVVIGGLADWVSQGRYRREARFSRSERRRLEEETAALRRAQAQPPASALPAPYDQGAARRY